MDHVVKFLNDIKPGCLKLWETYGILPSVAAGQAAIESGWGQSGLSTKYNNLFGIKGSYQGGTVKLPTTEFYDGKTPVQIVDGFRSYPNWSTSILDYGLFLNENPRYQAAIGLKKYKDQITAIWSAGYATDPDYVSKVVSTIEHNKLDQWDQEVLKEGGNKLMVTQAQGLQWATQSIGNKYDFDAAYGAQCFDLINQYAYALFKTSFSGDGAIDLLNTGNKNGFKVIVDGDGLYPQDGDIFIMKINSHRWGHTGIVLSADKVGMWVIDQNFDGSASQPAQKRYIKYAESYGVIKGWIRPPWSSNQSGDNNSSVSSSIKDKSGRFTVTVEALNVRDRPDRTGSIVATYKKGESFTYDGYVITDGHVWLTYISSSGKRCYIAEGPYDNNPSNTWGTGGV